MMEHGYVVLTTKGASFNNIMKMEFFDGTDIGLNPEKISGYIKINPLVSFYTYFLPMFNDEHHYLAKDNDDNVGVFIDTTDHPGIVGMFLWFWVMDKLLNIYDEDYLKQIRSGEIALYRKDGFREILIFDKTKTSVLCNNPKDICDHIKSIANGGVGAQHNGHTYSWPASKISLILFDMLDSDGNVVKTIPYFHNEGISQAPIGVIFEKLQKMVRIFEPDDLELNCLVNCKYKYTSTYIMLDKEAAANNKFL